MSINVMIVDDSAVVRQVLSEIFTTSSGINVMDVATDPIVAMEKMKQRWPDVIVLDVEMPRMDGITFLKQIMASRPTPVVICSSLTQKGADISVQAMAAGAVEVIAKPHAGVKQFLQDGNNAGAGRQGRRHRPHEPHAPAAHPDGPAPAVGRCRAARPTGQQMFQTTERIVAIGTSTGGTQALEAVLTTCPHLSRPGHRAAHAGEIHRIFAERWTACQIEVREAATGDRILPGRALIAPAAST
jgi:two-component system chemotaxis response regulator CheB